MNKQHTQYDITAPTVITPASPLNPMTMFNGYIVQVPGTSGTLTLNDCASLAEASAENQIISIPYGDAHGAAGGGNALDLPIETGLVVSSVPVGMTLSVIYSYYVAGSHG